MEKATDITGMANARPGWSGTRRTARRNPTRRAATVAVTADRGITKTATATGVATDTVATAKFVTAATARVIATVTARVATAIATAAGSSDRRAGVFKPPRAMMDRVTTLAVLLALALALPLPAAAARTVAPPGNSEADQYFQTLPGSTGPRAPDPERGPEDAVREGRLAAVTARALEGRGEAGRSLAAAVAQTAPADAPGGSGAARPGAASGEPATPERGGLATPERGGLGAGFPLVLLVTAVAAAAFVFDRRRRSVST